MHQFLHLESCHNSFLYFKELDGSLGVLSYSEVLHKVRNFSQNLANDFGARRKPLIIGIILPNSTQFILCILSLFLLDNILVHPMNPLSTPEEIMKLPFQFDAIFVDAKNTQKIPYPLLNFDDYLYPCNGQAQLNEIADRTCLYLLTSGSTGHPKGKLTLGLA